METVIFFYEIFNPNSLLPQIFWVVNSCWPDSLCSAAQDGFGAWSCCRLFCLVWCSMRLFQYPPAAETQPQAGTVCPHED
jgi:hypothetical protein